MIFNSKNDSVPIIGAESLHIAQYQLFAQNQSCCAYFLRSEEIRTELFLCGLREPADFCAGMIEHR